MEALKVSPRSSQQRQEAQNLRESIGLCEKQESGNENEKRCVEAPGEVPKRNEGRRAGLFIFPQESVRGGSPEQAAASRAPDPRRLRTQGISNSLEIKKGDSTGDEARD